MPETPDKQYVTEAMFLTATGRIERKVDAVAASVSAIAATVNLLASNGAGEVKAKRRDAVKPWAAVIAAVGAFVTSVLGAVMHGDVRGVL